MVENKEKDWVAGREERKKPFILYWNSVITLLPLDGPSGWERRVVVVW
jgi:hypothetical protein